MSVVQEVNYQFVSVLKTLYPIADNESHTYTTGSLIYTFYQLEYNTNPTINSILKAEGYVSGTWRSFIKTTDYTLSHAANGWAIKFTGVSLPDTNTEFYVDSIHTVYPTVRDTYPCDRSDLPFIAVETVGGSEYALNVGQTSARGYLTSGRKVLVYVTVYIAKETNKTAPLKWAKRDVLNMYVDAIDTKLMKNKVLGDYIYDVHLDSISNRNYHQEFNAFFNRMRFSVECIKEARY